jgi:hypothetical protein
MDQDQLIDFAYFLFQRTANNREEQQIGNRFRPQQPRQPLRLNALRIGILHKTMAILAAV